MKSCSKCQIHKDVNHFHKNKSKKDGLATECKLCKSNQGLKYRKDNSKYLKEYFKEYRQINKIQLDEKKKEYIANNKIAHLLRHHNWYEKNKDIIAARTSQYKKDHPEKYQMYSNRRVARKKTSIIEKFTHEDMIEKYGCKCFYCGGPFIHIDHYMPLSRGGSHTLENVRPSCETCNLQKSNKLPEEFIKYKGNVNE